MKRFLLLGLLSAGVLLSPAQAQSKKKKKTSKPAKTTGTPIKATISTGTTPAFSTPQPKPEVTQDVASSGLKKALSTGVNAAVSLASANDGYLGNPLIKIPFPAQFQNVESKLRGLGLGSLCDDFVTSMNRGAEKAAAKAAPIFLNSISKMTISDAFTILKGNDQAATQYLRTNTSGELNTAFRPIVDQSLAESEATRYWKDVVSAYNKIPFVDKINSDLGAYVTEKATDGLFTLIGQEEQKIRKNPASAGSDIINTVFSILK